MISLFDLLSRACSRSILPLVTGLLLAPNLVSALPAGAEADPRFALGYLVVTHYGATPDDGLDDTAAIQTALDDAFDNNLVLFFPGGVYQISDTLQCTQWRPTIGSGTNNCGGTTLSFGAGGANPYRNNSYSLAGEHGASRPVIKLVPNGGTSALFNSGTTPRPMLMLRHYVAKTYPSAPQVVPADIMAAPTDWRIDTSFVYRCAVRNLDFDCNGQTGAIGIDWAAAQGSMINDVKIEATGAFAGFYGLGGRNWGGLNVEVEGGRYGIRSGYGPGISAGTNGTPSAGNLVVGVTLTNQTDRAIDIADFVPAVITGFHIVKDFDITGQNALAPIRVVEHAGNTANNTLTLIDGSIELLNAESTVPAIDNPGNGTTGKTLYVRNLHVKGTTAIVQTAGAISVAASNSTQWHHVEEYSYTDTRGSAGSFDGGASCATVNYSSFLTWQLVDGSTSPSLTAVVTADSPPPLDLVSRHLPIAGFPFYEGAGSPATMVVTDYGATGDDGSDDTAAIQAAINAASTAGHGRVFLPTGTYYIAPTSGAAALTLRANTKLFGADKNGSVILAAADGWAPSGVAGDPAVGGPVGVLIQTEDDSTATTYLGCVELSVPFVNNYEHPFRFIDWKAGPSSTTFNLSLQNSAYHSGTVSAGLLPFNYSRFEGNGGGRHYFYPFTEIFNRPPSNLPTNTSYRATVIEGTTWPLWFYGFNVEASKLDARDTDVEIIDAANVVMLGYKREGGAPALQVRDSHNIALFGAGAMRDHASKRTGDADAAYVEISGGSDDLLMANLLVQSFGSTGNETTLGNLLTEAITGQTAQAIPYPLGVSLYRRGTFDANAAYPGSRVRYVVAGEDAFVRSGTYAATNYGANTSVDVRHNQGDSSVTDWDRQAYLKFDLSGFATDVPALRTSLLMEMESNGLSAIVGHGVRLVNDDSWSESTITWSTKKAAAAPVVDTVSIAPVGYTGLVSFDVTSPFNTELAGDQVLSLNVAGTDQPYVGSLAKYTSKEGSSPAYHPALEVILPPAILATIDLASQADTYVRSGTHSGNNYGGGTGLEIRFNGGDASTSDWDRQCYLRFDLSGVAGPLVSATLVMYVESNGLSQPVTHEVRFVADDSWSESTMTWATKATASSMLAAQMLPSAGYTGVLEFDVTAQVGTELAGDQLISLNLSGTDNPYVGSYAVFGAKENGTSAHRPVLRLVIEK